MGKNFTMVAKTLYGLEDLLASELRQLGASAVEKGVRNVSFEGDTGFMYKANLCCRTAIKILKPIAHSNVFTEDDVYQKVKSIPWEQYMDAKGSLAVDATVYSKYFTHSKYIALKTKDAIVDRFRDREGVRPDVDLDHPTLRIHVHIDRNICTVSLDSSGRSLHRRGYKVASSIAPPISSPSATTTIDEVLDRLFPFFKVLMTSSTEVAVSGTKTISAPPQMPERIAM